MVSFTTITWRALPAEFGPWNSVWKRFWRLSRNGVIMAFFEALADLSETQGLVAMFDSTVVRAHVSAAGAKGGRDGQALGRSRGGRTSKIHILTNCEGAPMAVEVAAGQVSDGRTAPKLLNTVAPSAVFLADGAYDSDALRLLLLDRGTVAAIPSHPRRTIAIPCDEHASKGRNVVERAFSHLKDWRRIATRYDKLKETFPSAASIAIICIWWT